MCTVAKGPKHGPAPIPEEGRWVKAYEIKDISGLSHGIGWCAPQQGCCKLTLNVKNGIIEEALVETIGCSGMTHSAAMAAEILPGQDHSGGAQYRPRVRRHQRGHARDLQAARLRPQPDRFLRGRAAGRRVLDDLGKGLCSQVGTMFGTKVKGVRYLEMTEGYVLSIGLDANSEVIGYKFVNLGKMMEAIRKGADPKEAYEKNIGQYGRYRRRGQVHRPA
jgi:NifU-like protein involved in Fe-S cluster formation